MALGRQLSKSPVYWYCFIRGFLLDDWLVYLHPRGTIDCDEAIVIVEHTHLRFNPA